MTLTVRLPDRLERELVDYCTTYRVTKTEAVKRALEDMLKPAGAGNPNLDHPYIGCDKGNGSDVSGNIKRLLRGRFRARRR
jgi:hypothetical protein